MYFCYIDEAGCPGQLPSATSPIQPALVIAGLHVPQEEQSGLVWDFLMLKKRFFPNRDPGTGHFLDWSMVEVKGSDVRKYAVGSNGRARRNAIGFTDRLISIVAKRGVSFQGQIHIKPIGGQFDGKAVYARSTQAIALGFQHFLVEHDGPGVMVLDGRRKGQNTQIVHSVFTQKYRAGGDPLDRVMASPLLGHATSHPVLQIADLVCSVLLYPLAVSTYCDGHISSPHVKPGYAALKARYAEPLKKLLYRTQDSNGRWLAGLYVRDGILGRKATEMLKP